MRLATEALAAPLTVSRRFAASRERVFDAWFDPDAVGAWLFATPDGVSKRVEIDARVGGGFAIHEQRGDALATHFGAYHEIVRPRRIVFSFRTDPQGISSTVAVDIEPDGAGGSLLTLTHELDPELGGRRRRQGRMDGRSGRIGARHRRSWKRPYADPAPHLRRAAQSRLESMDAGRASDALDLPGWVQRALCGE